MASYRFGDVGLSSLRTRGKKGKASWIDDGRMFDEYCTVIREQMTTIKIRDRNAAAYERESRVDQQHVTSWHLFAGLYEGDEGLRRIECETP